MKPLSAADVAASKGPAPKGPRVQVSPLTGQPIGVWSGAIDTKKGK